VIVLMMWLFIAGLVILIGAEVNVVLERRDPRQRDSSVKRKPAPPRDRN